MKRHIKKTLGLPGPGKSGKTIHFDWSIDIQKPVTPPSENNSQPPSEVVASSPSPSPSPPIKTVDTRRLPRCKRCDKPILWGQVTEELGEKSKRGFNSWIPFNPDYSFHGCTKRT